MRIAAWPLWELSSTPLYIDCINLSLSIGYIKQMVLEQKRTWL